MSLKRLFSSAFTGGQVEDSKQLVKKVATVMSHAFSNSSLKEESFLDKTMT